MSLVFDDGCQKAIDLAKRTLADGAPLDVEPMLDALYHAAGLKDRLPDVTDYFRPPQPRRESAGTVPITEAVKAALQQLSDQGGPVTAERLFLSLLSTPVGREVLAARRMPDDKRAAVENALAPAAAPAAAAGGPSAAPEGPPGVWHGSPQRQSAMAQLSSYGRMLTEGQAPDRGTSEMEDGLTALVTVLCQLKRHNAIVAGYPGTGKTALIYELARRIVARHPSIPERFYDYDVFELSPTFLRSGASVVGQYEERIKGLIGVLSQYPKIILFVDEIHSLFESGVHGGGPFTAANEAFKGVLARGEISCIGCTTLAEYKHYIEPDGALARRFALIRLDPPTAEATVKILESRLPRVEAHFAPLRVPPAMLARTVELTEEFQPGRYQPDKAIQLLDQACAYSTVRQPGVKELNEESLMRALEHALGRRVVLPEQLQEEAVFDRLTSKILGQDEVLRLIAQAFAAGLGSWLNRDGPRGVFLFGGPTGVGKTEVAQLLAEMLGGGQDALIRVDCNTLQGSGVDDGPIRNILLGVPPGYVGYARGQGGLLSKIRDLPACVVLFDEFEKASPGVGELLMRILDEGRAEDVDGNILDFRRSFIVFTSNAGCSYTQEASLGFLTEEPKETAPTANEQAIEEELIRRVGLGREFLARIQHVFLFQGLDRQTIRRVLELQLERLSQAAELRGYRLEWEPGLVEHLAARWEPQFGVRYASSMLRNRIVEQISVAEAHGDLKDVKVIRLAKLDLPKAQQKALSGLTGAVCRQREGDVLIIRAV